MKTLRVDTFLARWLGNLTTALCRRPAWFFYPQVVLFVVCVFYALPKPYGYLEFNTNRDDLVGGNKKYHRNYLDYKKEFPVQDDLVVVVESDDTEKNRQFVERLGAKLEAETNLFYDVFYKGDLKMMGSKALLFVPEKDLAGLLQALRDYRPFIEQFTKTTNLISFFDMVNTRFRTSGREKSAETDSLINALPVLERIVSQATASLRRQGTPPSPGVTALFNAGKEAEQQAYITFGDGQIYLVSAHPPSEELSSKSVERLRALVEQTQHEVTGVNVGITGGPVLEYDEMAQSKKDMTLASIVSLVLCAFIFVYGYQETGRPVKATICLIVGLAYTMAFATLTVGHLNVLTITFVPMLIGLAIDYGVHLVSRYEEELRRGRSKEEALTKAMVFTGQGIFTGALTTAVAFLAMGLTNFKGIQEMGVICGGGLMICLVPMMTLLPVLLLRGRQNVIDHKLGDKLEARARIENIWLRRPVWTAALIAILCGLALTQWPKVRFDYNLLNMQSAGLASVEFEKKLIHSTTKSVLFGVVVADSLDEAVALEARLKELPAVSEVDSMSTYLNEDPAGKLELIGRVKQELAGIHFRQPDAATVHIPELSRSLYSLYGYLGAALDAVGTEDPKLSGQLESLRRAIEGLRREMLSGPAAALDARGEKLGVFQRALFDDVRETFDTLRNQDNRDRLHAEDLPQALRDRFVGVTGKHLLQVYPKKDLWQRENQREFIREIRLALDPQATNRPIITGTPVQLYEYTNLLKRSYEEAGWYALGAIALMVLIHFRSFSSVILALLPVVIGSIWLGGLMGYFDIPLNPANIMTLPLVIGIGVTNGIHILNRFAEEREPSILAKSTGKAVLVSGLTTIAGFGSLILAKHQGIESLGYVMATGVAMCMIAGLTFLPALLNLLMGRNWLMKRPSAENARSTLGREEPR
jgi:uncharacterized protein